MPIRTRIRNRNTPGLHQDQDFVKDSRKDQEQDDDQHGPVVERSYRCIPDPRIVKVNIGQLDKSQIAQHDWWQKIQISAFAPPVLGVSLGTVWSIGGRIAAVFGSPSSLGLEPLLRDGFGPSRACTV